MEIKKVEKGYVIIDKKTGKVLTRTFSTEEEATWMLLSFYGCEGVDENE